MNPVMVLLTLRVVELLYMMVCLKWIIESPKNRLRDLRLTACWIIVGFNLAAIVYGVIVLKGDFW